MYSRSYYPDGAGRPSPPENYDGCAFSEQINPPSPETGEVSFIEDGPRKSGCPERTEECGGGGLGQIPLLSGLLGKGGLLGGLNLKLPTLGTEEILILAMAAFLFFSKWGDKESAIMLLLLLLIN